MADTDLFRGHEGVRRGIETWLESGRDFRFDPREVLERGDRVLVIVHYLARGRGSGVELDEPVAHVWEFRGDRAIRLRMFGDADKARRRFLEGE
jgi:ketosteroid isomerase-like protein